MSRGRLEHGHEGAAALGTGSTDVDVALLLSAHADIQPALESARPEVARAIDLIVESLGAGRRLVYVGAGTSGWLAALDAAEVAVTFGMVGRVASLVGGGLDLDPVRMTLGDDAVESLDGDPILEQTVAGDVVLAVSASGRTPYTLSAVERLRARGAHVIALVNDEGSPLESLADVVICVPVAGELVAGSTRLTAGAAQKIILNTISTASMVRLGRTYRGQMVAVEPLNEKLRQRVVFAIAEAASVETAEAAAAMAEAGRGDVAVVMLVAGVDASTAAARLDEVGGHIARASGESTP